MAEKEHGPLYGFIVITSGILMIIFMFWFAFKYDIMNAVKWLCIGELYAIDFFVENPKLAEVREVLMSLTKKELDIPTVLAPALYLVGSYMKYIFALFFLIMSYKSFLNPVKKMLRNKMGLDDVIKYQAKAWPYITPFVDYNPGLESSREKGESVPKKLKVFAEALSPEEWVVYNDIDINDNYEFDEAKAKKYFKLQLGKRWRGTSVMPDYQRALFAAFALKGARKREESDAFLGEISLCWSRKHGFVMNKKLSKRVTSILKNPKSGHEAVKIANNHAYVNSAMLSVLAWARNRGGVLAPAQFVWLRGVDRDLWYALNSLGRRTYFSEGSGSIAHFHVEKGIQKPLVTINVDRAIDATKDYFEEHYPKIPIKEQGE